MSDEGLRQGAGPLGRTIFRVVKNKDNPYVMIDRRMFENKELSWEAKGLLGYMLSRPDNWDFNVVDLINRGTNGEFSVRAIMGELRRFGHLLYAGRIQLPNSKGTKALWEVHERPVSRPRSGFRDVVVGEELVGHVVVPTVRKTRSTNKESTNRDDDDKADAALAAVSRLYEGNVGIITPITADLIRNAVIDFPLAWFEPAIKIACGNNVRKWSYIEAILDSWKVNGFAWKPAANGHKGPKKSNVPEPKQVDPVELERMRTYARTALGGN